MFEPDGDDGRSTVPGANADEGGEGASEEEASNEPAADMFATETMAELSARQGRVPDAVAIYRHLLRGAAERDGGDTAPDERTIRWKARLADLEAHLAGGTSKSSAPLRSATPPPPPPPARPVAVRAVPRGSLVIREPVRSGQVVYAEGRDLIAMASVHPGAQLIADGNIHVYAPLKGRAVAGARGARDAQVFCLALEAELVGVDTGYFTSEDIPPALWSGAARIYLDSDGVRAIAPLLPAKPALPAAVTRTRRLF
jgi:septum formation inhibitor MinC